MVVDAHKRSHTIVAVDANGRQLASKTITTTTKDHLALLNWAEQLADDGEGLLWAVEDCRHLSRRSGARPARRGTVDRAGAAEVDGARPRFGTDLWQVRSD